MKILFLLILFKLSYGYLNSITSSIYSAVNTAQCTIRGNCCTSKEIPANILGLESDLTNKVYGQPFINKYLVNILRHHWYSEEPPKALTISFHGGPGIGKNYVVEHIIKNLYRDGITNPHVHYFTSRIHFPEARYSEQYKRDLIQWIKGNTSSCPQQLFVFDEIDKMAPGILDGIKPFIDYVEFIDGINFQRCIFIFISNTGSQVITGHTFSLWRSGVRREDMKMKEFEKKLLAEAYNVEGGFYHSDNIKSDLIDHYIPFLPLEEEHVRKCIVDEFNRRHVSVPSKEQIEDVLEYIDWGPEPDRIFSKTGCKSIRQKVPLVL